MRAKILAATALMLTCSACGTTPGDRALSGAGIGAGAGTVTAILVHGNPITGLALGAAAGAITGAVTNEQQLDGGKPLWR